MLVDFPNYRHNLRRVMTGLYETVGSVYIPHLMPEEEWMEFSHEYPEYQGKTVDEKLEILHKSFQNGTFFNTYGSCDSIKQFSESSVAKIIADSIDSFIVVFDWLPKQNGGGGYRFHKNGEYIGTKSRGFEYLADEPDMDGLYQYHIFRRRL